MTTFDTARAVRKLREAGAPEPVAEGIVDVVAEATSPLVAIQSDVRLIKWMIGALGAWVGLTATLVVIATRLVTT